MHPVAGASGGTDEAVVDGETGLVVARPSDVDAVAAAMADSSRRASRSVARGGQANAIFILAAVERLPVELTGFADAYDYFVKQLS